jgi:hypothetical protein
MAANFHAHIPGGHGGLHIESHSLTLASGTGTIKTSMRQAKTCFIVQTGTPVAEGFAWSFATAGGGGTVTITSNNGSSTAALQVTILGF